MTDQTNQVDFLPKDTSSKLVLRVKRKANEDPLEQFIIEGEQVRKKIKLNPLFGLERMLGNLQIQEDQNQESQLNTQDANDKKIIQQVEETKENSVLKEKVNDTNTLVKGLFDREEEDANENVENRKKRFVLTLVSEEQVQLRENKQQITEDARKRARNMLLDKNRKSILELTVDSIANQVKLEKTKSDSNIGGKDYAYYEVKEANETEENEESISQMLQKSINQGIQIMKIYQGINLLNNQAQNHLFDGQFESDKNSNHNSSDSNRESAEENDYPDEDHHDDIDDGDDDDDDNKQCRIKNYKVPQDDEDDMEDVDDIDDDDDDDDDDSDNQDFKMNGIDQEDEGFENHKVIKNNRFKDSIYGISLAANKNQNHYENDEDESEDEFTKKYNKYYHKTFDNDFQEKDFE